ncbi:hypothetical protein MTO96_027923 [Rhipicephalus appendiculatus]
MHIVDREAEWKLEKCKEEEGISSLYPQHRHFFPFCLTGTASHRHIASHLVFYGFDRIHSYMAITLPYDFAFLFTPSTPMGSVELCHIHYHGTCNRVHNTWPREHTGALGYTI